jgi:5-methylthioadenosine/S-adenosylhomocysteine deaminase
MSDQSNASPTVAPAPDRHHGASAARSLSRRCFLKSSIGLAAGEAAAEILPGSAVAQSAGAAQSDTELTRLQRQHPILLKGGVVLTLDRQVGDFVQADVLIEDGKISAVRPNIAVSAETAVVDAANHILIPGFVDTHSHWIFSR